MMHVHALRKSWSYKTCDRRTFLDLHPHSRFDHAASLPLHGPFVDLPERLKTHVLHGGGGWREQWRNHPACKQMDRMAGIASCRERIGVPAMHGAAENKCVVLLRRSGALGIERSLTSFKHFQTLGSPPPSPNDVGSSPLALWALCVRRRGSVWGDRKGSTRTS